jgi:hypothetical protein
VAKGSAQGPQVEQSGGEFPAGIAVHGKVAYGREVRLRPERRLGHRDGFRVEADGALAKVTTAEGLSAFDESGTEGIAAV